MKIAELKEIQSLRDLCDVHLVEVRNDGFVIAHTDEERASIILRDCDLHMWMTELDEPPCEQGVYIALRRTPGDISEPYGVNPWHFIPLEKENHDHYPVES